MLDYEWPPSDLAHAAAPGIFVLGLVAATAWALARRRPEGFLGAWFFVVLAPTSTVIPIVTESPRGARVPWPPPGMQRPPWSR